MQISCKNCGTAIRIRASRANRTKFCSMACRREFQALTHELKPHLKAMRFRCRYREGWADRGIQCLITSTEELLAILGPKPGPGFSVDRIDVNGNYEAGNIRWATQKQQMNNRTNNIFITYQERTLTLQQWADETGLSKSCLHYRYLSPYWSVEEMLTTPPRKARSS